ncbi:Hypothetical protein KVN_LOCUS245 [uncultured virus]|nr:Hypothetical protein KVN_LOCUS245 [uncultured virus]
MNIKSNFPSQLVTENEINLSKDLVYNFDEINLPVMDDLLLEITNFLEYILQDDMINMKISDFEKYEKHLEKKFENFTSNYYGIFKKIINLEDISPLFIMLRSMDTLQNGYDTVENVEKLLGKHLYDKFKDATQN